MSRYALALKSSGASVGANNVLNEEDFNLDFGLWTTPGVNANVGDQAWTFNPQGSTPSTGTGPGGGANPITLAVETSGNGYVYAESSDGGGNVSPFTLESPAFDASQSTLTLTFSSHTHWNLSNNATFSVEGWNGAFWSRIGPAVTAGRQAAEIADYDSSSAIGVYTSAGFSNPDFRFRFRNDKETVGPDRFQYDTAVDNAKVTGGGGSTPTNPITVGLDSGLRRIHVRKDGNDSNNGLSAGAAKLTVQAALSIAQAGDVISIAAGNYRERPTLTNFAGTVALPLWIVAEIRGTVIISDTWEEAENGTVSWTDEGGGVYSAVHGDSYIGSHLTDFLMRFKTEADLRAASVQGTQKPPQGFAFEGGRIYVRLRNDVDPNGQSIVFCETFQRTTFNLDNADNVIIDGISFVGAGDTAAVDFDTSCANPTIRNCISTHNRHMNRNPSDTIVEWCDYSYVGFGSYMREILTEDGAGNGGIFDLFKDYHQSGGNAFLEGGISVGTTSDDEDCEWQFNYIHDCFEGMRLGEFDDSKAHDNVFEDIGDNIVEFESFRSSDKSADLDFFHNLCLNCHDGFTSHQAGNNFIGPHFIYRNLFLSDDGFLSHPTFIIKTINAPGSSTGIHYYRNGFKNIRGVNENAGGDTNQLWSDGGSQGGDKITTLQDNWLVFEQGFDDGSGPNPNGISGNILISTNSSATVIANGGSNPGSLESDLKLGSNYEILAGSPLIGAGSALSGSLPDVPGASGNDVGPFPNGFDPGPDWPRPRSLTFEPSLPSRWTSPGP